MFGNVVKASHTETGVEYAIKILRNNDLIMKSGEKEFGYLKKINSPHITKCHETFFHRSHYCLVFELMGRDARSCLEERRFTLEEVKGFAVQLFIGLHAIRKQRLIHADIKPDNLLLSVDRNSIKFCDFGTAFTIEEANII